MDGDAETAVFRQACNNLWGLNVEVGKCPAQALWTADMERITGYLRHYYLWFR